MGELVRTRLTYSAFNSRSDYWAQLLDPSVRALQCRSEAWYQFSIICDVVRKIRAVLCGDFFWGGEPKLVHILAVKVYFLHKKVLVVDAGVCLCV